MDILKKRKTERLKKLASAKDREISALKDEMKILMDENARLALHGEAYKEAEGRLRKGSLLRRRCTKRHTRTWPG